MKKATIKVLVMAIVLILACVLFACGKNNDPDASTDYSTESRTEVSSLVSDLLGQDSGMWGEDGYDELPEWVRDYIETADDRIISALQTGGITNGELKSIIALANEGIEMQAEFAAYMEDEDATEEGFNELVQSKINELKTKYTAVEIPSGKIAKTTWALIKGASDIVDSAADELGEDGDSMLMAYDTIIDIGEADFVTVFTMIFDIMRVDNLLNVIDDSYGAMLDSIMSGDSPDMPTAEEFRAIVVAGKTDVINMVDTLFAPNVINALVRVGKVVVPMLPMDDEEFADEIIEIIDTFSPLASKTAVSIKAGLNSVDNDKITAFYNTITEVANYETAGAVVIGKVLNSVLTANGGLSRAQLESVFVTFGFEEEDFDGALDELYAGASYLNGLNYTATVNKDYNDFVNELYWAFKSQKPSSIPTYVQSAAGIENYFAASDGAGSYASIPEFLEYNYDIDDSIFTSSTYYYGNANGYSDAYVMVCASNADAKKVLNAFIDWDGLSVVTENQSAGRVMQYSERYAYLSGNTVIYFNCNNW